MMMTDFTLSEMAGQVWDTVGMEILLFVITVLGFYAFRSEKVQQLFTPVKAKAVPVKKFVDDSDPDALSAKRMETDYAGGRFESVLKAWSELQNGTPETLTVAIRALLELRNESELPEFLKTALELHSSLHTTGAMNSVLGVVSTRDMNLGTQVYDLFESLGVGANDATFERILGGLKEASLEQVGEITSHMKINMTSRVYSMLAKAAMKSKRLDRALTCVAAMHEAGHPVPPSCLGVLFRMAGDMGCVTEVMKTLPAGIAYPAEAIGAILEHAQKSGNQELLQSMQKMAIREKVELTYPSYDALIKAYASRGDTKAVVLFQEMLEKGFDPSEGSVITMVTLCAESKHVQFAEQAVAYSKQQGRASLALYSALMKVYQCAKLFQKTCDLYEEIAQEGVVELDTVAYGSVIKAAVEGGRLELARKLFLKSGNPDLRNYMSLIRAAGREKNSQKALELLKELEASPIEVDTTAYNCVLDVCVRCGDPDAARDLMERMKAVDKVDVISYNTLLKGLTQQGLGKINRVAESEHVKQGLFSQLEVVLEDMAGRGLKPNVVTYNSLINAFISNGDMTSAWKFLEDMEKSGVPMDNFTCAIMMKGLKHSSQNEDVDRILSQMERAKVVPDEVLVNTLLDACVRLRDPRRLNQALDQFKASGVVPSMHAYATLIRAYGHAHRLDQAWRVWREIKHDRKASPTEEVYGAMIDACVQNEDVEAGNKLFAEMRTEIPKRGMRPDTRAYTTIIEGCLRKGDLEQAVRHVNDAMGLDGAPGLEDTKGKSPRVQLEAETIEHVLLGISRRQRSQDLGAPLLARLRKAGFEPSNRAASAVGRSSPQWTTPAGSSRFHARRGQ